MAEAVGVSDVLLSAYVTGRIVPPLPKLLLIEQASSGWVTTRDWGVTVELDHMTMTTNGSRDGFSTASEITEEKKHEIAQRCLREVGLALKYASDQEAGDFGYPLEEVAACISCRGEQDSFCRGEQDSFCGEFRDRCAKVADFVYDTLKPLQFEPDKVDPAGWGHLQDPRSLISRICLAALSSCAPKFPKNGGGSL